LQVGCLSPRLIFSDFMKRSPLSLFLQILTPPLIGQDPVRIHGGEVPFSFVLNREVIFFPPACALWTASALSSLLVGPGEIAWFPKPSVYVRMIFYRDAESPFSLSSPEKNKDGSF